MLFATEYSDIGIIVALLAPLVGGIVIWIKADAAEKLARATAIKADRSHEVVKEIRDIALKTEEQTNSRLSDLDAKVHAHEIKCIESQKREADLQRQIAELKLALSEATRLNH